MSQPDYRILIVDDESNIRKSLELLLGAEGYRTHLAADAIKAYEALETNRFDLALVDIRLGSVTGLELFRKMTDASLDVPVVFMSGNASRTEAVEGVRLGAIDFVEKPFHADRVLITVSRALEHAELKRSWRRLSAEANPPEWIAESARMRTLLANVDRVAGSQATVLIQGESGTGKELIAKRIHAASPRRLRPFVRVNCSAIPETLIESELFGHEKGAFTGALAAKRGYFELANGGTLFLDEIGDMSLSAQAKVLRALQNAEIQKVGAERILPVDVRIVAATHKDLKREVEAGRFREDLFYRINVVPLQTIPLREIPTDIPHLVHAFLRRFCERHGLKEKSLEPSALERLTTYSWPGNVRELQNLVERLVVMGGETIRERDLPPLLRPEGSPTPSLNSGQAPLPLKEYRDRMERDYIISVLRQLKGNVSKTAEALGIERTHLHKKIQQYGITKREYFF